MKTITFLKRFLSAAIAIIMFLSISLLAFAEETEPTEIDASSFESATESVEDYIQSEQTTDTSIPSNGELDNSEDSNLPPISVPSESLTTDTDSEYLSEWSKQFGFDITIGNFAELDTSSFTAACERLDATAFGQLLYEVPSSVDSISALNLRYAELTKSMADFGYGTQYELKIEQFNPGYASDLLAQFENTYGDTLSDEVLNQDMSSIMSGISTGRDSISDVKETEEYKNAHSALGNSTSIDTTTNIIDILYDALEDSKRDHQKEAAGLTGLEVPDEIWDVYYEAKESQDKNAKTTQKESSKDLNKLYNEYLNDLPGYTDDNKQDQFSEASNQISEWLADEEANQSHIGILHGGGGGSF